MQLDPQTRAFRLQLSLEAPLYAFSTGRVETLSSAGVFQLCTTAFAPRSRRHFEPLHVISYVAHGTLVSEVEAFIALGAIERLLEMDLGDAAISLRAGDLVNARYQLLRARDGL